MGTSIQIWLCIGFIVYYSILQIYSDIVRSNMATDNKNLSIEKLRSEYKVRIRTFRGNKSLYGFSWFKTIWINEILFNAGRPLLFTFYHEYYHLKHKHKFWTLFFRFIISLTPLSMYFVNWIIFVGILLFSAYLVEEITDRFEKNANDYARKMTHVDS